MYSSSHTEIEDYDKDWTVREISFAQKKNKRIVFINIDRSPLTDWFELIFGIIKLMSLLQAQFSKINLIDSLNLCWRSS